MYPTNEPKNKRRTGPFGPAGEILPQNQRLETLQADDNLFIALSQMCESGFNQAPVVDSGKCAGVLRFFDVMRQLLKEQWFQERLQHVPVRNHVDREPRYIGVEEWVDVDFDWQLDDIAMVGTPHELKGMLTATDILGRLTDYVQAFVYIEEIELDTRDLFALMLPLPGCFEVVKSTFTQGGLELPRNFHSYDQLSFGHYANIFGGGATSSYLQPACDWPCKRIAGQVQRIGALRNALLHFRRKAIKSDVDEFKAFADHAARALECARTLCAAASSGSIISSEVLTHLSNNAPCS